MHFSSLFTLLTLSYYGLVSSAPAKFDCQHTKFGVDAMQRQMYKWSDGTWEGGSAATWNWANAMQALTDYMAVDSTAKMKYKSALANSFKKLQQSNLKDNSTAQDQLDKNPTPAVEGGFIDEFYDDNGWWALAWIRAYDVTKEDEYLNAAKQIFEQMKGGWSDKCDGGIWWKTDKQFKNAIANELFLSVAASLANRVSDKKDYYVDWAKKELDWFKKIGLINDQNTINDGLNMDSCENNKDTVWTYNQGVILGGLVELDKASPNGDYIDLAHKIADGALDALTENNVLKEKECEPNCGGAASFKGAFIRNLSQLQEKNGKDKYKDVILTSADSLWQKARHSGDTFGDAWAGPDSDVTVMSESSACDLLVAAYKVSDCSS